MKPVVLMRKALAEEGEAEAASSFLPVYSHRTEVPEGSLVIGRYSVLPYYRELEEDLADRGSRLINTYRQHRYVANIREWYEDLQDVTPRLYASLAEFKREHHSGSFVLKGETNSKKFQWDTHMFAQDAESVQSVYFRLCEDSYVGEQDIVIRDYVPLRNFGTGLRGLPITEEYRFFVLDGTVVGSGFYWSQFPETEAEYSLAPSEVPKEFLDLVIDRVADKIRFFVIDVARAADGKWLVVELNDGCMSGLSAVQPNDLYRGIKRKMGGGV